MTQTPSLTKSSLMTAYNKARAVANRGYLDMARVNRAFGILQQVIAGTYATTTTPTRAQTERAR